MSSEGMPSEHTAFHKGSMMVESATRIKMAQGTCALVAQGVKLCTYIMLPVSQQQCCLLRVWLLDIRCALAITCLRSGAHKMMIFVI